MPWASVRSDYPSALPGPQPKSGGQAVILLPKRGDCRRAQAVWIPTALIAYLLDSSLAMPVAMGLPTPLRRVMAWNGWTALVGPGVPFRPGAWDSRHADE